MGIIYKLTHIESGKSYIGQTKGELRVRLNGHKSKNGCPYISQAIQKYGMDAFQVSVLAEAETKPELNTLEVKYIKEFNTTYPNGYNLRNGGDGSYHNEESKKKIAQKAKEQFSSIEVRNQSSLARGGVPFVVRELRSGSVMYEGTNKTEACRQLGIHRSSFQKVLRGKSITVNGFVAKYASDSSPWPTEELWIEFMAEMARCKAMKIESPKWSSWIATRIA
jgi:hypothetical protein